MAVEKIRDHRRAAAEHTQALRIAGIRHAPAAAQRDDETRASVAAAAASADATKPGAVDVDRDAVFTAIGDLVEVVDDVAAAGGPLMVALADPLAHLTDVWADQTGDGPITELVEAARSVVDAAQPHAPSWPPALAAAAMDVRAALGESSPAGAEASARRNTHRQEVTPR
jgi:hypothetical protein